MQPLHKERIVCTDHDGTLTESEKEMLVYEDLVVSFHKEHLGLSETEILSELAEAKSTILAAKENYGWSFGAEGLIVAAATSDHYIFYQTASDLMLKKLVEKSNTLKQKIDIAGGIEQYLVQMFTICYPQLPTYYRSEAKDFLEGLQSAKNIQRWAVVTNSDAAKVMRKLEALHLDFTPTVIGGAKKFVVNRSWNEVVPVGPCQDFPGFPTRGVELQRETFYNTLIQWCGEEFPQLVFIEDVAEFVLWIDYLSHHEPELASLRTALVLTGMTPEWEKAYYTNGEPQHFASPSLVSILNWIQKLE